MKEFRYPLLDVITPYIQEGRLSTQNVVQHVLFPSTVAFIVLSLVNSL